MLSKTSFVVVLLLGVCFAQQSSSSSGTDKQVRLEDIERDTLSNSQQRTQTTQQQSQQQQSQQQQTQQQYGLTQQQLAAYQQQLLLQQLQQQYFAPQPISYPNFNSVPLMIIPGNHLGVGSPALPLQAYFLPDPYLYQQQGAAPATQQAVAASVPSQANSVYQVPTQRIQPTARYQPLVSNQLPVYRIPQGQQPVHNFIYTSTPPQATPQQHLLFQQQAVQQPYNAYNAIYQQQQQPQKNLYSSGIKSTPAPPSLLKSSRQSNPIAYSQTIQAPDQTSSSYINYKSF